MCGVPVSERHYRHSDNGHFSEISVKSFHALFPVKSKPKFETQTFEAQRCSSFKRFEVRTVHTMRVTLESAGVQNAHRAAPSKRLKHRKPFIGLTTERWANFNANRKKARRFVSGAKWRFVEQQDLKRQLKIRQSVKTAFAANSAVALYQIRPARRSEIFVGELVLDLSGVSRVWIVNDPGYTPRVYYAVYITHGVYASTMQLPSSGYPGYEWHSFVRIRSTERANIETQWKPRKNVKAKIGRRASCQANFGHRARAAALDAHQFGH